MKWVMADALNLALDAKKDGNPVDLYVLVDELWNEMQMQNEEEDTKMENAFTVESVAKALEMNCFKETTFRLLDGTEIMITPCSYVRDITDISQCDYFLVDDPELPWAGGDKLSKVVNEMNNHVKLVDDLAEERAQLRAYFDKHQKNGWDDESFSWYSDWHKDLYGYRPHGYVCGEYVRPY